MLDPFNEKTEPDASQPSNIKTMPKVPQREDAPVIVVEGKVYRGIAQMVEEENELLGERQRLLDIMEELENRLMDRIRRRQSATSSLRSEVSALQAKCEKETRKRPRNPRHQIVSTQLLQLIYLQMTRKV